MIPRDFITEWRSVAPWVQDSQVEQDLIISRALVVIFSEPALSSVLAFRGGTALYKLHIKPAARYSEDIDLVQLQAGPIGPTLDLLRSLLDPWLGSPKRVQNEGRVTLCYRFDSEDIPPIRMRLKIEINSREHFTVFGVKRVPFAVSTRWFTGRAEITTYELDELLGTKLRALYQRRKGRDLLDLAIALLHSDARPLRIAEAFSRYMEREGGRITRAQFERNLAAKLARREFITDIEPLLAPGQEWSIENAEETVRSKLITLLPGDPWKGEA